MSQSTDFERSSSQYLTKTTPTGLPTGNNAFTIFGWVKLESLPSAGQNYFLFDYTNGTNGRAPFITNDAGTYKFALSDYVASHPTTITVTTGVWYFWAVTHDSTNTRLYWNQSLINTTARTLAMGTPTTLRISSSANSAGNYVDGLLFGVGITTDAKSLTELRAIRALTGSEINGTKISNLVGAWCVDGNHNDVLGTNNLTGVNTPTFSSDEPSLPSFKKAVVNSSMVPSTQTNFPSYVDLSRLGITTLAQAQSIRVYSDSTRATEWAREIVSATEMHVKVPSLTSTVEMYVEWDGIRFDYAVTDTYGRNAVWSNERYVGHLQSSGVDSTGNHSNTDSGLAYTSQKIGNGGDFEASSNAQIHLGNVATGFTTHGKWSAWLKPENPAKNGMVFGKTNASAAATDNYYIYFVRVTDSTGYFNCFVGNGTTNKYWDTTTFDITNRAKHDITYNTTDKKFRHYINGVLTSTSADQTLTTINNATSNFYVGRWHLAGSPTNTYHFDGEIDEARVAGGNVDRISDAWFTTEYNNQSDESTFWGTWSNVGGATNTTDFFIMM